MNKYVCIHGHFYQPPRENPWLEEVELQDNAYPYHDWNTRITEECYLPNTASRILAENKEIIDIVNNYASISFNFGPSLLIWLEKHSPEVYRKILDADKESMKLFSGHGSALAQCYNHMIMPLANLRDKHTQVIWGIRDFEHRFNRKPEGMWLPETAVNTESLEVLAEHGIKFTILTPYQARKFRRIGDEKWTEVGENGIDPTRPYLCELPSGREINLFFYEKDVSHDIAYGGLLHSGADFAGRFIEAFGQEDNGPRLVHIATDGESYGHHHRHGDMALAFCLHHIRSKQLANITIYGEYLEKFPPEYEVQIRENTSWSCAHGVERWRSHCGCNAGRYPNGTQQWRGPLRKALDQLRDKLMVYYENEVKQFVDDPWQLRNEYIELLLDRTPEKTMKFLNEKTGKKLSSEQVTHMLKLLEIQRNAMLMYTSCGWFFDDIAGIETTQIMKYATRAMQLVGDIDGNMHLSEDFKSTLAEAETNDKKFKNARQVYETYVEPSNIDLNRVGAHFAITSLFKEYKESEEIFCYTAQSRHYDFDTAGIQKLAIGRTVIQSNIVMQKYSLDFAALYFGGINILGAVSPRLPDEEYNELFKELKSAFKQGNTTEVIRLMNTGFTGYSYSLWHMFKDEQRRILFELLENTWKEIEASFRHIYEYNYSIMSMMRNMKIPLPEALLTPAQFVINQDMHRLLRADTVDLKKLRELVDDCIKMDLELDKKALSLDISHMMNRMMTRFYEDQQNCELLQNAEKTLEILGLIVTDFDLYSAQNIFFSITRETYPEMKKKAAAGDKQASTWVDCFEKLAEFLDFKITSTGEKQDA